MRRVIWGVAVGVAAFALAAGAVMAGEQRTRERIRSRREGAPAAKMRERTTATKEARQGAEAPRADERRRDDAPWVDRRQAVQARRIEQGVRNGSLTAEELAKLRAQQEAIEQLEDAYKGDGKLTLQERRDLHMKLNYASRCIFAEKHDAEGTQMPVWRFGGNVYAKEAFLKQLEDESLTREQARQIIRDFRTALRLKHRLASENLGEDERARLQAEYNEILNRYFEIREATATREGK